MRLAFMGTPVFAAHILSDLIDWAARKGHWIPAVYTQPPRPAGRGKQPRHSPVHELALLNQLPVFTPKSLNDASEQADFARLNIDVAVVAAYGLILPKDVLEIPHIACINVHASLLPRWRGAAPIQRAVMAGDRETGISIMHMEEGLDTGPVFETQSMPIEDGMTAGEVHDALAGAAKGPLVSTLEKLERGTAEATPQDTAQATYAKKIRKSEAKIDWSEPAAAVDCRIRALSPFPGAFFEIDGERIKVLRSRVVDKSGDPGDIIDNKTLIVACGEHAVELLELQRSGRKAVGAEEFLRGFSLPVGTSLG